MPNTARAAASGKQSTAIVSFTRRQHDAMYYIALDAVDPIGISLLDAAHAIYYHFTECEYIGLYNMTVCVCVLAAFTAHLLLPAAFVWRVYLTDHLIFISLLFDCLTTAAPCAQQSRYAKQ